MADMADMARNSERHLGFTRSICVRLLNYLLMPAEGGGVGGEEALPVKCKGAISRMPNLTCVSVYVCVSLSPSLWIRIQIEVTNLNWPQKWLPLPLALPRLCPLWRRLAKSNRNQGLATCLCTQCPPQPPPLPPPSVPHLCRFQCCPLHTVCASYIMQHWSQANSLSTPRSEAVAEGKRGSSKTHNAPS